MFTKIHQKLGTAGFIISIVALVAALGGGAYAASGGLTGKQKKEVEKIAKKYAGKPGPAGKQGPAGAAGATGAAGPTGTAGAKGETGAKGEAGPRGTEGQEGEEGEEGEEGSPWTAGGTLPSEATETGVWGPRIALETGGQWYPISFTIPLAASLDGSHAVIVNEAEGETSATGCPGQQGGTPTAEPGYLCVYVVEDYAAELQQIQTPTSTAAGAGTSGAFVSAVIEEKFAELYGTWAVTGK